MARAVGDRVWKVDQAGNGAEERADVDDSSTKEEYGLSQRTRG